jgi:hypothetical protein
MEAVSAVMAQKCNEITCLSNAGFHPSYVSQHAHPQVFAIVSDPGKHHDQKPSPTTPKKLVFTLIPVVM